MKQGVLCYYNTPGRGWDNAHVSHFYRPPTFSNVVKNHRNCVYDTTENSGSPRLTPAQEDINRGSVEVSKWGHSFTRLFTILRAALWAKLDLLKVLGAMGRQVAASVTWRGQNKPISRDSYEAVGQQMCQTGKLKPSVAGDHVKNSKPRFAMSSKTPSETQRKSSDSVHYGMAVRRVLVLESSKTGESRRDLHASC